MFGEDLEFTVAALRVKKLNEITVLVIYTISIRTVKLHHKY